MSEIVPQTSRVKAWQILLSDIPWEGKEILLEWQGFPGETLKELHIKSEAHAAVNKLNRNTNKT